MVPSELSRTSLDAGPLERRARPSLADERLLSIYAPTHLLIDSGGDIIRSHGKLTKYLEFPTGTPTANVKSLSRKSFRKNLVPLLRAAEQTETRQAAIDVQIDSEFGSQVIDLVVDPLPDRTTLVLIKEQGAFRLNAQEDVREIVEAPDQVHDLEEELRLTRFRLRATVEELETANEELKSSNEEMMSMNEELQSSNEELSTVNEELKNKADQLSVVNAEMKYFLKSTDLALIVLDEELVVRNYTDAIKAVWPLKSSDKGRALSEVASLVDDENILRDAQNVLRDGGVIQRLVVRSDGSKSFSMQIRPFLADLEDPSGVTITFVDVTQLKTAKIALQRQTERLRLAITAAEMGIWNFEPGSHLVMIDAKVRELFGLTTEQETTFEAVMEQIHEGDRARIQKSLDDAITHGVSYDEQFRVITNGPKDRWLQGVGKLIDGDTDHPRMFGINFDITAQKEAMQVREVLIQEMNHRVKNLFSIVNSMVAIASRKEPNTKAMSKALRSQISALGTAHDISYATEDLDAGLQLSDLVNRVIDPFVQDDQLKVGGPDVIVTTAILTPLSLILHEWATNSVKYGSLSKPSGRLKIDWSWWSDGESFLNLRWIEENVEGAVKPDEANKGFGSRLIDLSSTQFGGVVKSQWNETEIIHELSIPPHMIKIDDYV